MLLLMPRILTSALSRSVVIIWIIYAAKLVKNENAQLRTKPYEVHFPKYACII
jgi:hypothetical protein